MSETILVLGSTGTVGRPLVEALVAAGRRVRGATRDPERAALPAGVDAVRFDYADPSTYDAALDGVGGVYLLSPSDVAAPDAVMRAFVAAAARGGRTLVLQSASDAETPVNAPLLAVERMVAATGAPHVVLRPNWFMDNFRDTFAESVRRDGTFAVPAADARSAFIDARDIAAAATAVFAGRPAGDGRPVVLTGPEALTYGEAAAILAEAAGRPIRYRPVTPEEFVRDRVALGMPEDEATFFASVFDSVRAGLAAHTTDAVERLTGRPPRTLAAYARDHADAWRGGPAAGTR